MPHIPKPARIASTGSVPAEVYAGSSTASKPHIPVRSPRKSKNPFLGRMSPNKYNVPPEHVFKVMFGQEFAAHEHTGMHSGTLSFSR